jgi:hypothetical protein
MMQTIQHPTKTKARKKHICDLCRLEITAGSTYLKSTYKLDDIYTWKMHQHCSDIASKLKMYDDVDEGLNDDIFSEYIHNEYYKLTKNSDRAISFCEKLDFVLNHHGIIKKQ